jgi:hypothetical protein
MLPYFFILFFNSFFIFLKERVRKRGLIVGRWEEYSDKFCGAVNSKKGK